MLGAAFDEAEAVRLTLVFERAAARRAAEQLGHVVRSADRLVGDMFERALT